LHEWLDKSTTQCCWSFIDAGTWNRFGRRLGTELGLQVRPRHHCRPCPGQAVTTGKLVLQYGVESSHCRLTLGAGPGSCLGVETFSVGRPLLSLFLFALSSVSCSIHNVLLYLTLSISVGHHTFMMPCHDICF